MVLVPRDRHGGDRAEVRVCGSAVCSIGFTWPAPGHATDAAPAAAGLGGLADRVAGAMAAASVRQLCDHLSPGALVVDVGAGTGLRARALSRAGHRVVAVEPDATEALRATAELADTSVEVHRAGVGDLADVLDGRRPDAVLMWHVLEHLPSPDEALGQVAALMGHDGLLSVAVPNRASLEAAAFGDRWHAWEPSRHRWHFDARSLRLVLGDAGFGVGQVGARGGWGYPSSLAFSLAPGLDPQVRPRRTLAGRALAAAMVPVALGARATGRGAQLVALAQRA